MCPSVAGAHRARTRSHRTHPHTRPHNARKKPPRAGVWVGCGHSTGDEAAERQRGRRRTPASTMSSPCFSSWCVLETSVRKMVPGSAHSTPSDLQLTVAARGLLYMSASSPKEEPGP